MKVSRVTTIRDRFMLDLMISGIVHSARKDLKKGAVSAQGVYGLVICGASESGCRAFVSNMLREPVPEGILCLGTDSDPVISHESIVTGLVLILPEVAFLREGAFDFIIHQIVWMMNSDFGPAQEQADKCRIVCDSDTTERMYGTMYTSFQEEYRGKVWIVEQDKADLSNAVPRDHYEACLDRPGYRAKRFGRVKRDAIVFDNHFAQLGGLEICQVLESALAMNPNTRITVTELAMRKMFEHIVWNTGIREPSCATIEATQPETYVIGD